MAASAVPGSSQVVYGAQTNLETTAQSDNRLKEKGETTGQEEDVRESKKNTRNREKETEPEETTEPETTEDPVSADSKESEKNSKDASVSGETETEGESSSQTTASPKPGKDQSSKDTGKASQETTKATENVTKTSSKEEKETKKVLDDSGKDSQETVQETKKPENATKESEKVTKKSQKATKKSEKETKKSEKATEKSAEETTKKADSAKDQKKTKESSGKESATKEKPVKPGEIASVQADESNNGSQDSIIVRWSRASGAEGYGVYRSVNKGDYQLLERTSLTSYTDQDLTEGNEYRYLIRAYKKAEEGYLCSGNAKSDSVKLQQDVVFNYEKRKQEVPVTVLKGTGYLYPLASWYPISADFYETVYHTEPHNGTDIAAPKGTYVLAITDGTVAIANSTSQRGNQVVLDHQDDSLWSRYQHMDKVFVQAGDQVKKGQIIGMVGNTGNSTGPHLHIELGMGTNYESITSYLDGGSLIDVMLYLPSTAQEVAKQQEGTYQNPYFTNQGKLVYSRKLVKKTMKKKQKISQRANALMWNYQKQTVLLGFDFGNEKNVKEIKVR